MWRERLDVWCERGIHVLMVVLLGFGPLALGGAPGGLINLPALVIALLVTWLLMIGTSESAKVNAVLVLIKVAALTAFIALTLTSSEFDAAKFNPFLPAGVFGGFGSGVGAVGAAAALENVEQAVIALVAGELIQTVVDMRQRHLTAPHRSVD